MSTTATTQRIHRFYDGPFCTPIGWRQVEHPQLKAAVRGFVDGELVSGALLAVLVDYLDYWIDAPSWTWPTAATVPPTGPLAELLHDLRGRIKTVDTREALAAWIDDARPLGLYPL